MNSLPSWPGKEKLAYRCLSWGKPHRRVLLTNHLALVSCALVRLKKRKVTWKIASAAIGPDIRVSSVKSEGIISGKEPLVNFFLLLQ